MNREIKFRAWDNHKKEMIAEGYHVIGEVTMFGMIDQWVDKHRGETPSLEYYNHIIEMQFTGLKDKNGKEIYEGDICRTYSKEYPRNKEVVWDNGMACFRFDYPLGKSIMQQDSIEVIGNIYENPELLNQGKGSQRSVASKA